MSESTYSQLTAFFLGGATLALFVALGYLIGAMAGWRGPNRNRRLFRCGAFAVLFPCLVACQYLLLQPMFSRSLARERLRVKQIKQEQVTEAGLVKVGETAPSFRVVDADGKEFSLDQMRGKVVLVNFFATWCGQCIAELPHVEEIWKANRHSDEFCVLVIGREETNESASAFRKEYGFSFPVAADPDCSVYFLYAQKHIPRTYLISREGKVCFESTGWSEDDLFALRSELGKQLRAQ